jgi:hypothetical protein
MLKKKTLFLCCALMLLTATAVTILPEQQQVTLANTNGAFRYVATYGSDSGACTNGSAPCRSIQYAVNQSASGDAILVGAGTYGYSGFTYPSCGSQPDRAVVCFVDLNLTILGGYANGNWAVSDPSANPTVIDGQSSYRGVLIIAYASNASLRMEGFTIQNGAIRGVTGPYDSDGKGAGMWAQHANVTLRNVAFRNNKVYGGDLNGRRGASGAGGGLAITSSNGRGESLLENVYFEGNLAQGGNGSSRGGIAAGGGLFVYDSTVKGNSVSFVRNIARAGHSGGYGADEGNRADGQGGGFAANEHSNVYFTNIYADSNEAYGGNAGNLGGGAFGGAAHGDIGASVTLIGGRMQNNYIQAGNAQQGGIANGSAFNSMGTTVDFQRLYILGNTTRGGGSTTGGVRGSSNGAIYVDDINGGASRSAKISNSIIANNNSYLSDSGSSSEGGGGGGVTFQAIQGRVSHVTFANNKLGGGLYVGEAFLAMGSAGMGGTPANVTVEYSIIANHNSWNGGVSTFHVMQGSTVNMNRNLFVANTKNFNTDSVPLAPGAFNGINSTLYADNAGFTSDYHLQGNSPAINQASGSGMQYDIDGDTRNQPDIGADEYGGSAPQPTATPIPPTAVPPTATPVPPQPTATQPPFVTNTPMPTGEPPPEWWTKRWLPLIIKR